MNTLTTLIAKPIVDDQYWVITDGEKKVGNVIANGSGFDLLMRGKKTHYETASEINVKAKVTFQAATAPLTAAPPYAIFPTTQPIYNSMLDVKRSLHLYTKTEKSKCYYAAGWFKMDTNGETELVFCPKYIFLMRYPFTGPFKTKEEAAH